MRHVYPIDLPRGSRLPEHGDLIVCQVIPRGAVVLVSDGTSQVALPFRERVLVDEATPERQKRLAFARRVLSEETP